MDRRNRFGATCQAVSGRVLGRLSSVAEPHITLVQGIAKGAAMDEIVQHAVELGVERIIPLMTERTVVRLEASKESARVSRWQRIAQSAARQSQRSRVPDVEPPATIAALPERLAAADICIVLWEEPGADSLPAVLASVDASVSGAESRVALVVGPEGGLTAEEVAAMQATGALVASLGPSILRAQTAALAAVTLASYALGGLGASEAGDSMDIEGTR